MHEITCYHLHEMCIFTALQVIMKGISSIIAILGLCVIVTVKAAHIDNINIAKAQTCMYHSLAKIECKLKNNYKHKLLLHSLW